MSGEQLKPCPFCGGAEIVSSAVLWQGHYWGLVECLNKACLAHHLGSSETDAISTWNRRAPSPPVETAAVGDGRDIEAEAWSWLDKKFGTTENDRVDIAYAASEMVMAFHAGSAFRALVTPTPSLEDAERVGVIQADRDAAAAFYGPHLSRPGEVLVTAHMRAGKIDESPLIQAFRAHRLAHASGEGEVERLRLALRSIAEGNLGSAPWQANYERIRQVAAAALSPKQEGGA